MLLLCMFLYCTLFKIDKGWIFSVKRVLASVWNHLDNFMPYAPYWIIDLNQLSRWLKPTSSRSIKKYGDTIKTAYYAIYFVYRIGQLHQNCKNTTPEGPALV